MRKYLFSDINNLLFYIPQIIYLYFANPAIKSKPTPLQRVATDQWPPDPYSTATDCTKQTWAWSVGEESGYEDYEDLYHLKVSSPACVI